MWSLFFANYLIITCWLSECKPLFLSIKGIQLYVKTVWNKAFHCMRVFLAVCILATRWKQHNVLCSEIASNNFWADEECLYLIPPQGQTTQDGFLHRPYVLFVRNHDVAVCNELMGNKISDLFMQNITNQSNSSYSDVELIICCRRTVWHIGSYLHGPLRWHPQISGHWSEKLN